MAKRKLKKNVQRKHSEETLKRTKKAKNIHEYLRQKMEQISK